VNEATNGVDKFLCSELTPAEPSPRISHGLGGRLGAAAAFLLASAAPKGGLHEKGARPLPPETFQGQQQRSCVFAPGKSGLGRKARGDAESMPRAPP